MHWKVPHNFFISQSQLRILFFISRYIDDNEIFYMLYVILHHLTGASQLFFSR